MGRMAGNLAPKAILFLLKFEHYWPVEALLTRYFQARCTDVHLLPMRQRLRTLSHGKGLGNYRPADVTKKGFFHAV